MSSTRETKANLKFFKEAYKRLGKEFLCTNFNEIKNNQIIEKLEKFEKRILNNLGDNTKKRFKKLNLKNKLIELVEYQEAKINDDIPF